MNKMNLFLQWIAIIVFVGMILFMGAVILTAQGKLREFKHADGTIVENSISEKIFIDVNGHKNGLIIRGQNVDHPVLLFLSGGPGVPEYWLNEFYENRMEDYYTVCWWDWTGEGMSFSQEISKETITTESLLSDAKTVAGYLKERFGKEKIYLMAHSGGTPLGLRLAQKDADDFYCYFAMGQLINENDSRFTGGYDYLKAYYEARGDHASLQKLKQLMKAAPDGTMIPVNPETIAGDWEKLLLRAGCGTTRAMKSDAVSIFFPQMLSKCYTVKEKINFWRGKRLNTGTPYDHDTIGVNEGKALIPVYFISGEYDYTCPVTLVKELYGNLDAPDKELFIFHHSAHSPLWEENEAVLQIMLNMTEENRNG